MEKLVCYDETNIIPIGRVGENDFRTVKFDIADILSDLPDANISLLYQRNTDAIPYVAETTIDGTDLKWLVNDVDTAVIGYGRAEIIAKLGDVVAKSRIYRIVVNESLDPSGDVPDPFQSWHDEIMQASVDVAENTILVRGYRDDTEALKNETSAIRGEVEQLRNSTEALKNAAETAQSGAEQAKTEAVTAKNAAEEAAEVAREVVINKVDKIPGKGLSTNDFTDAEKTKLASLENYNDSPIREIINSNSAKIEAIDEEVAYYNSFGLYIDSDGDIAQHDR